MVFGFFQWWGIAAATTHETDGRRGSLSEHELPTESTGREADAEDASPTTNREALKTWARAGARSHTRHGSITGSNGKNRSVRPSLLGKDIIDALVAAARTEIEEEVSVPHVSEDTFTKSLCVTISFVRLRVLNCRWVCPVSLAAIICACEFLFLESSMYYCICWRLTRAAGHLLSSPSHIGWNGNQFIPVFWTTLCHIWVWWIERMFSTRLLSFVDFMHSPNTKTYCMSSCIMEAWCSNRWLCAVCCAFESATFEWWFGWRRYSAKPEETKP
jgi:hypothetical protein